MKKITPQVTGAEKILTKLFSVGMLMEQLSISRPTANRLVYGGILKTVRVGRAVRIPESSVIEFIQNGGQRNIHEPNDMTPEVKPGNRRDGVK